MKKVYTNEEVCIGCRLCEIHCLVEHSQTKRIIKAFNEENPRALPRILVEEDGPVSFALQCQHCKEPDCVQSCMSGAMQRDKETQAIICDTEKCVGCWMCVMSCSYGGIKRDLINSKAIKCDLCQDKEIPACVENCPNQALTFEEREGND